MEQYLDGVELAQLLKIPITSVDYYRRAKGLPSVRIGKHNRYLLREVQNWMDKTGGTDGRD